MTLGRRFAASGLLIAAFGCGLNAWMDSFSELAVHASSKAVREQGAILFHEKGCEHCHGVDGMGTERGPSLTGVGRRMHKPKIQGQILHGGKEMPPYDTTLNSDEVQQLVAFLSAKKKKDVKPAKAADVAS